MDGERPPLDTIAALAAHHAQALPAHLPDGPYLWGGLSMGGNVAFETARLLAAAGRPVSRCRGSLRRRRAGSANTALTWPNSA